MLSKKWSVGLFLLGSFFFFEGVLRIFHVPEYILPLPSNTIIYFFKHWSLFFYHGAFTFLEAFIGVLLAWGAGILLGGLGIYFRFWDRFFSPILFVLQVVPVVAMGPFFVLWFGFGFLEKVWVVFLFALYPIIMAFKEGVRGIDPQLLDLSQLIQAPRILVFFHVLLPACLLRTLLGVKIAFTYSVTSAIVAELLGSHVGLGVLLVRALSDFNTLALFADIWTIVAISMFLFWGISLLENKAKVRLGL